MDASLFYALYEMGARPFVHGTAVVLAYVGSGWSLFALLPAFALEKWRRDAAHLLGALLATALFVYTLKAMVGRERPWLAFHLAPPFHAPTDPSFPSGHAAGSATVAAYVLVAIARRGSSLELALLLLPVLAFAIGLSRVVLGVHYPLDVAAGALLGGVIGTLGAFRVGRGKREPKDGA